MVLFTNSKLAEFYALGMPIFVYSELWRMTRRGSHALSGRPHALEEVPNEENRSIGAVECY